MAVGDGVGCIYVISMEILMMRMNLEQFVLKSIYTVTGGLGEFDGNDKQSILPISPLSKMGAEGSKSSHPSVDDA